MAQERLLVGYRDDDERRYFLPGEPGGIRLGTCIDCRHPVYGDRGALNCLREREPKLACMYCHEHLKFVERVHPSGLIAELT